MADRLIQGRVLVLAVGRAGAGPYLAAAGKLRLTSALAVEQCDDQTREAPVLERIALPNGGDEVTPALTPALQLRFAQRESGLEIMRYAIEHPLFAIIASDESTAPACARAASMLALRWHPPRAADLCLDQFALRQRLGGAGFAVPLPGESPAGQHFVVAAMLDGGKMRVLGTLKHASDGTQPEPVHAPTAIYETVLRAASEAGLAHGPVSAQVCLQDERVWILQLRPIIPATCVDGLHFRIPLVDEDVSLAEVIVRHAVGMDISRIYAQTERRG